MTRGKERCVRLELFHGPGGFLFEIVVFGIFLLHVLVGQMGEQIAVVRIEVEHGQANVTRVVENDQRFHTGDQHVTTNVELLPVNQQRIHDVSAHTG